MLLLLCALSLVATISGDMKRPQWVKVFAEEGRSTVLHCSLSHQHLAAGKSSKDAKSSGKWTKEDGIRNSKAILSLTPSGIEINGYQVSPRFTIQQIHFLQGDFSLHIQSVKYEDAGRYAAKIQYGDVKQDCHIFLHVIRVRASPSGLFLPGSSVTLTCSCTDSSRLKEVLWYHDGTLKLPAERNRFTWSQMTLPVIREAHGGEWRCEHRYRDGSRAQAQYQLQVQGIAAPASNLYTVYAPVGSRAELPCFLKHDSQGETKVQWDQTTALGRTRTIFTADTAGQFPKVHSDRVTLATDRKRNYSLSISVVSESDAGQYSCSLTLHKWRITRQIRLVMLKVTPEKNRLAQLGTIVRLNCSLSEESGIEQYTWTQKTAMVNDEKSKSGHSERRLQRRQYTGQTLELSPVSQDDTGPWVCTIYANNKTIGEVTYVLEVTGAQHSGPFVVSGGKISYAVVVLVLFLLVLTAIAVLVLHNRRDLQNAQQQQLRTGQDQLWKECI